MAFETMGQARFSVARARLPCGKRWAWTVILCATGPQSCGPNMMCRRCRSIDRRATGDK